MSAHTFSSINANINLDENINWLSFNKDEVNGDSLPVPKVTKSELNAELDDIHYGIRRHYQHRNSLISRKKRVAALYY